MQYLVGDVKQGITGFQRVHVHRNEQPRFSCQHTEMTQGLQMIPRREKITAHTNTSV